MRQSKMKQEKDSKVSALKVARKDFPCIPGAVGILGPQSALP